MPQVKLEKDRQKDESSPTYSHAAKEVSDVTKSEQKVKSSGVVVDTGARCEKSSEGRENPTRTGSESGVGHLFLEPLPLRVLLGVQRLWFQHNECSSSSSEHLPPGILHALDISNNQECGVFLPQVQRSCRHGKGACPTKCEPDPGCHYVFCGGTHCFVLLFKTFRNRTLAFALFGW